LEIALKKKNLTITEVRNIASLGYPSEKNRKRTYKQKQALNLASSPEVRPLVLFSVCEFAIFSSRID
jgi:hypothetical protein